MVGVPLNVAVAASNVTPVGSVPVSAIVVVPLPPVAVKVTGPYAVPNRAGPMLAGATVIVGHTIAVIVASSAAAVSGSSVTMVAKLDPVMVPWCVSEKPGPVIGCAAIVA